ncbi:MAG: efflux RND transporter periplasmic adaptor subunit [Vicinamibacterales bacterium]|nr:efflux RND transporter periplasmic adaptor subunit [Vicinamibacterales bacterium]
MRKVVIIGVALVAIGATGVYMFTRERTASAQAPGAGRPGGGMMGGGGGFGFRPPMTVEVAPVGRADIAAHLTVVGNLIGQQTVDVVPRTGGRLISVNVRLGDRVSRGQLLGKIEDREIVEQVKQAEASLQVAMATIRQREADLKFAEINLERSRNLFERQLLPRQSLDDADARYSSSFAQLDLSRAQLQQTQARLDELKINLANTEIRSPVNGFVGQRNFDVGAWVSTNAPVASVVDISSVRLVANVVERDLRLVNPGDGAVVEVDAFPGQKFTGTIARVSPVLDPQTRTAEMEIEVPNPGALLKPGMYARVDLTVDERPGVLVAPKTAIVDYDGRRGAFVFTDDNKADFVTVQVGIDDATRVEITGGLTEGQRIVVVGASSLRQGDNLVVAGQAPPQGGQGRPGGAGKGRPQGGPPGQTPRQ